MNLFPDHERQIRALRGKKENQPMVDFLFSAGGSSVDKTWCSAHKHTPDIPDINHPPLAIPGVPPGDGRVSALFDFKINRLSHWKTQWGSRFLTQADGLTEPSFYITANQRLRRFALSSFHRNRKAGVSKGS
jgi:hypothetical protein